MKQNDFLAIVTDFFRAHPVLSLWLRKLVKLAVVVFFVGLIFGYSLLKYSEKPEFCKTCHYMKPFYDAWMASSHNRVRCIECHYAPGIKEEMRSKWEALSQVAKYVTGTYGTKPWAEINDRSCLRSGCHDKSLLRGKVVFGSILFDHGSHFGELRGGKRLRCTSCHSQIVQGEHMTVTTSTCFVCHFKGQVEGKGLARCTFCHSPPMRPVGLDRVSFDHRFALEMSISCTRCHFKVTWGSGRVPEQRCYYCHLEPERIAKYGDTILLHDVHITDHKVECSACHLEIEHRMESTSEAVSLDCCSCHPGHHAAQKELYMGTGGQGVSHCPDPMFLARVNCGGCHIEPKGDRVKGTRTVPSAVCMSCHGVEYSKMLGRWEKGMKAVLKRAVEALDVTDRAIRRAEGKGENVLRARRIFEKATYNVNLVACGKGAHNIRYSQQLVLAAVDSMNHILELIGFKSKLPAFEMDGPSLLGKCYQCHFGMKSIVRYDGKSFSHDTHVARASLHCLHCHVESLRARDEGHGELVLEDNGCVGCHHASGIACRRCHPFQYMVYYGRVEFVSGEQAGPMAEAGVECEGCHFSQNDEVVRPTGEVCAGCHEEVYAELKADWQSETRTGLKNIEVILSRLKSPGEPGETGPRFDEFARYERLLDTVVKDGSYGVHNYQLIEELLSGAERELKNKLDGGGCGR